jgi:hypothetical protein
MVISNQVVGIDYSAASTFFRYNFKGFFKIQISIVIGKLFAWMNIPDRNFKFICSSDAIGIRTVIDEPGVVPAKDVISQRISVSVRIQNLLVKRVHASNLLSGKNSIQFIERPGDGTLWNSFSGDNSISNFLADKLEFGMGMDHVVLKYVK